MISMSNVKVFFFVLKIQSHFGTHDLFTEIIIILLEISQGKATQFLDEYFNRMNSEAKYKVSISKSISVLC